MRPHFISLLCRPCVLRGSSTYFLPFWRQFLAISWGTRNIWCRRDFRPALSTAFVPRLSSLTAWFTLRHSDRSFLRYRIFSIFSTVSLLSQMHRVLLKSDGHHFHDDRSKVECWSLLDGHRFERQPKMPHFIYDICLQCWRRLPLDRPHFRYRIGTECSSIQD